MCTAAAVATGYVGGRYAPVPIVLQLVTCVNTLYTGTYEECIDDGRTWRGDFAIFNFFFSARPICLPTAGHGVRVTIFSLHGWPARVYNTIIERVRPGNVRALVSQKGNIQTPSRGGEGRRRRRVRIDRCENGRIMNGRGPEGKRATGETRNKDERKNCWTFRDVPESPVVHTCFVLKKFDHVYNIRPFLRRCAHETFPPLSRSFSARKRQKNTRVDSNNVSRPDIVRPDRP